MTLENPPLTYKHLHNTHIYDIVEKKNDTFNHPTLLILPKPLNDYDTGERELLTNILKAVKIEMEEVDIWVNNDDNTPDFFQKNAPTQQILVFGITPPQIGLNMENVLYYPINILGKKLLFSNDLDQINKKSLWAALKVVFG